MIKNLNKLGIEGTYLNVINDNPTAGNKTYLNVIHDNPTAGIILDGKSLKYFF